MTAKMAHSHECAIFFGFCDSGTGDFGVLNNIVFHGLKRAQGINGDACEAVVMDHAPNAVAVTMREYFLAVGGRN